MSIPPIAAIVPVAGSPATLATSAISPASAAGSDLSANAASSTGGDFASMLSNGIDAMSSVQNNASSLAVQAATGSLVDPAQYTAAATQATLMTQLATTIQSKAVTAFNTIMGMQA